jgi:hypothetical protein
MPIGLLIGWLIGQLFIGISMMVCNTVPQRNMSEASMLVRQVAKITGMMLAYTALPALIGTAIELYVR